jgi:hypothetical protein
MKKLLAFLSLLLTSVGAWAGYFTLSSPYDTQGGEYIATNILGTFVTNETDYNNAGGIGVYEVAAFIDGECRAVAVPSSEQRGFRVTLRVPSNSADADLKKAITFRVYNNRTGKEYNLTASPAMTFQGDVTIRTTLTLNAATDAALKDITMNVGETVDLMDYLTLTPEGSSLPLNQEISWYLGNNTSYAEIKGNQLTAKKPTGDRTITIRMRSPFQTSASIKILQPATGITINRPTEITYRIGESEEELNQLLTVSPENEHYTVTPEDATDQVQWEIGDETIIGMSAAGGGYALLKPGVTTVTPIVIKSDGTVLRPSNPDAITITVVQPVTSIDFNWCKDLPAQVPNKANVGDDVYQRLAALVEVLPADATDKTFTFSSVSVDGTVVSGVTIGENSLVFTQPGTYAIQVVSNDNPRQMSSITFEVENPAKEVLIAENPLDILISDDITDLTSYVYRQVNANVSLDMDNKTTANGKISATGTALTVNADRSFISVNGINIAVTAAAEGTSTVTITMQWDDYSNYDGTAASIGTIYGTPQSFVVRIASKLRGFMAYNTLGANGAGTLRLVPIPEGAQYDASNIEVTMQNYAYPEDWSSFSITNRTNGADDITLTYTATMPGEVTVTVSEPGDPTSPVGTIVYDLYDGNAGADGVQNRFEKFHVPATYSFASGWQWRSNYYGDEVDNYDEFFNATFLNSFDEARTQTALLINDDYWGLFSDGQFGISQGQCFKIKMKANANTTMTYGSFNGDGQTAELYKGWTWVGSPFFYNRLLTNAIQMVGATLPVGTRIVSKNNGFAEWNGTAWTGSLTVIEKNQGYLINCPESGFSLSFGAEGRMSQGDEAATNNSRNSRKSVWNYDDSQFANNMSMVAELKNVENVEDYTVGAFVDGECRGEGVLIDGKAFITVHGNSGELVTFRLHNELTGEFFDVVETVKSQQMLGTLQAPVTLSIPVVVTGIQHIENSELKTERYDLLGRKNPNAKLTIVRTADGKMRKVVK